MTILIAEDETAIREIERAYLAEAGYEIVEAPDGRKAVEIFQSRAIDLVVLDLSLPGISGLEVCRAVRELSVVPILMVTARNSDEDEVAGLEMGADDYLKKPFNPHVLVARVQTLLRRKMLKQLRFPGLTIDPVTMGVAREGRAVKLTTTRFNLLLALASNPNVVMSRGQLVDQIYKDPAGEHLVYDRTIDAHVKALRKYIEADPHRPQFIETVIGAGYRFRSGHDE